MSSSAQVSPQQQTRVPHKMPVGRPPRRDHSGRFCSRKRMTRKRAGSAPVKLNASLPSHVGKTSEFLFQCLGGLCHLFGRLSGRGTPGQRSVGCCVSGGEVPARPEPSTRQAGPPARSSRTLALGRPGGSFLWGLRDARLKAVGTCWQGGSSLWDFFPCLYTAMRAPKFKSRVFLKRLLNRYVSSVIAQHSRCGLPCVPLQFTS